jgi:LmbE family N-acetylglucosaminyl deacetylase
MLAMLPEDWHTALAIVAHPDDLEYGTASAVARWTAQGKHVYYLLVTSGEAGIDAIPPAQAGPLREAEERRGARLVGVDTVEFLGYPDGVIEYSLALRRDLSRYIRRYRPDTLVTTNHHLTWPGNVLNMADHRWVGQAVLDAARDAGNRWIFPELLDEQLNPWSGVRMVCLNDSLHATHAVDVTDYMEQGIASLQAHQTYLSHLTEDFNPETFLRQNARTTGEQCGCTYAVGFEVIVI